MFRDKIRSGQILRLSETKSMLENIEQYQENGQNTWIEFLLHV
jgi:hypothetical protein